MIFCQYFEYIHLVAFNPLAFQFSTQIYVWCFCFVIPPPFYEIQIHATYFIFQRVLQAKRLMYTM